MPILIHAANGLDACDASCYMARHQKCTCICGGVNHGKGLARAAENTRRLQERLGQTSLLDLMYQNSEPAQIAPEFQEEQNTCRTLSLT